MHDQQTIIYYKLKQKGNDEMNLKEVIVLIENLLNTFHTTLIIIYERVNKETDKQKKKILINISYSLYKEYMNNLNAVEKYLNLFYNKSA